MDHASGAPGVQAASAPDLHTFDRFEPGRTMGSAAFEFDEQVLGDWCRLFPGDDLGGVMPHGMIAVVSMQAYTQILQPRPPGNVHVAQGFDVVRLPRLGETLTTSVRCLSKELLRSRRRVVFGMDSVGSAGPAFAGRMAVLWAR
jgi:hypothetical protein